jgi:hypothetical protein
VPPCLRRADGFPGFCTRRGAGRDVVRFLARAPALRTSCDDRVFFRFKALARAAGRDAGREAEREDFLPAFRRAEEVRVDPPVRADARAPELAGLFDGVFLCRLLELFRADPAALRFAAFLAMVIDPCMSMSRGPGPRNPRIDCRALSDVSSNAYRN